jgi:hypothetical protein
MPDNVIDFIGLPNAVIGTAMDELTASGVVSTTAPGCGPTFTSMPNATPVFGEGTLVLIWANPPLHTPENVAVGTPVQTARNAYPGAVELPAASGKFAGLLVTGPDDLAYLFLHDGTAVQKVIVGVERFARLLFDTGFGSC